jgi:Histidine kinase-, DNA gyrase B-, and HSP90-like ATPase
MDSTVALEGLAAQRRLIEKLEKEHFGWDIIVGDAFVRGMRDIGYKSTSYAVAELVDNAIQASARRIDIIFGYDDGTKPSKLAVVDDGYGMEPKMVRAALVWGAGTREGNRTGFGKYGYGLPSASVSQCHRVTVYSKTPEGSWHSAYLDIDEIGRGEWSGGHRIEMPPERAAQPPRFVVDAMTKHGRWPLMSGTVVLWENLDRIDFKQRDKLRSKLLTDLGVIYRNYLLDSPMTVDGVDVEPCDPLFLTEGFRYYDLDEDRAVGLPSAPVEIKDKQTGEVVGRMRVRFARMPATFFRRPEYKHTNKPGRVGTNARLEIADANNGIIFLRDGRQIDVVRPPRALASINVTTDRFWAVEVDFDPTLDDLFSITTSKQQIRPDDSVWDMLKDKAKLFANIGEMRTEYKKEAVRIASAAEDAKRASVEAIEEAAKFRVTKPPKETPARLREAEENLRQEARRRAAKSGVDAATIERELVAEAEGKHHVVETEDMPGAPFFRCVQRGGQRVLLLNVAHPFYSDVYAGNGSTPRLRAGLEVLLWTLGEAEVDADPDTDRRRFYERERASVWTPYLNDSLTSLRTIEVVGSADGEEDSAA